MKVKTIFVTAKGDVIRKDQGGDARKDAKITRVPENGTWEVIISCEPTEKMVDTIGDELVKWLRARENMAKANNGEGLDLTSEPDSFRAKAPSCAITQEQAEDAINAYSAWANTLLGCESKKPPNGDSKPQDGQSGDDTQKKHQDGQGSGDTQKKHQDDQGSGDTQQKKPQDGQGGDDTQEKHQDKKYFWELTEDELFDEVNGSIDKYLARYNKKQ